MQVRLRAATLASCPVLVSSRLSSRLHDSRPLAPNSPARNLSPSGNEPNSPKQGAHADAYRLERKRPSMGLLERRDHSLGQTARRPISLFCRPTHSGALLFPRPAAGRVVAQQVIPQADLYPLTTPAAAYTATTPNTAVATPSSTGLPAGWSHADIGQPPSPAARRTPPAALIVSGGGTLIGGVNDGFQFAYQQQTGEPAASVLSGLVVVLRRRPARGV